jgi:hypothetical protein
MNGWLLAVLYVGAWAWVCSPWLRFALLPGLQPHRGIPLVLWPWTVVTPGPGDRVTGDVELSVTAGELGSVTAPS